MNATESVNTSALIATAHCRIAQSASVPHSLKDICDGCPAKGRTCRHRHGPRQLYAYWMRRRRGRTAQSIRTVVRAAAVNDDVEVDVDFVDA